jgi:hypothetical protein
MELATFEAIRQGDAKLELNQPIDWELKGTRLRSTHRLRSALSVPVTLVAAVGTFDPHRPTFIVHDGGQGKNNACRLDVRGTHRNRRTDHKCWINQSHLHLWRDDCLEAHAVDPFPPWPPAWFQDHDTQITSEQLRELFEMFCQMFHVKLGDGYDWTDPLVLIPQAQTATTEDGDVIP